MATNLGIDPLNLLSALVGSQTQVDENKNVGQTTSGTSTQTGNQAVTGSTNTSGSSSTSQSGNTSTSGNSLQSQNLAGTSQQQNTQYTQNIADVGNLNAILQQQLAAGNGTEQIKAIFQEGAKATPALISAYANAVGARPSMNSPLADQLQGLLVALSSKAQLNQGTMLNSAADTAKAIAQLTSQQQTTGSQQGTTSQVGSTNTLTNQQQSSQQQGTTNQSQSGTTVQNTSSNQTANNTQQQNTNTSGGTTQSTNVNDDRVLGLLGLLAGGSILNNGLTQAGIGGISGAISGGVNTAGGGIADLLKMVGVGNGSNGTDVQSIINSGDGGQSIVGGSNIDALLNEWLSGAGTGNIQQALPIETPEDFWNYYDGTGG